MQGSTALVLCSRVHTQSSKRHRLVRISGTTPFASLLSEQQLDEFGYVPFVVNEAGLLYQAMSEGHGRRGTAFTTNVESGRWGTVYADDKLAAAIVDHAMHHGRLVEFGGPGRRLEESPVLGKGQGDGHGAGGGTARRTGHRGNRRGQARPDHEVP
jgi:hypothetical protein